MERILNNVSRSSGILIGCTLKTDYKIISQNLFRLVFLCLLFVVVAKTNASAQGPVIITHPSGFPQTCQPNSPTSFSHTQAFVVSNGDCGNNGNNGAFTFRWEYFNGTSWAQVGINLPNGFSYSNTNVSSGNGSNIQGSSILSITLSPTAAAGQYQFRGVATFSKCGTSSVTSNPFTFLVNPRPTPLFLAQPGASGCINTDYTYTTESAHTGYVWGGLGQPNVDYTLIAGGTNTNSITLRWLTPGTKTVTINYTNANGCTAGTPTASTPTVVGAPPTPTFTSPPIASVCSDTDVTYTTQAGSSNYLWSFTGTVGVDYSITSGGTGSSNTVTLKWLSSGSKSVSVNYSNASGCSGAVAAVTSTNVNARPTPSFTSSPGATSCVLTNVTYTALPGRSDYVWNLPGALNTDYKIITGAVDATSNTVTIQWLSTGTKIVTVNYTNGDGCTGLAAATSQTEVSLQAVPEVTAGSSLAFCSGGNVVLSSSLAAGYQWYIGGVLIPEATQRDYTATIPGTYTVQVSSAAGCQAVSAGTEVVVYPIPNIVVSAQAGSLCFSSASQSTQLAYSSTVGLPVTYSIDWDNAANSIGFVDISNQSLPAGAIPLLVPAGATGNTSFTGFLTVSNAGGCTSVSKTFTVSITAPPDVSDLALSAASGCAGTGSVITVKSGSIADGTYTVTYDLSGDNVSTGNTAIMSFTGDSGTFLAQALAAGSTNITITQMALVGCATPVTANNTAPITINALPATPVFSAPSTLCIGSAVELNVSATGGFWSSSEPSIATVSADGIVTGLVKGNVVITYTTAPDATTGCTNSTSQSLDVIPLPSVGQITGAKALCINTTSVLQNSTGGGTWSSSNTAVATIDNNGLITTHQVGSTEITYVTPLIDGCTNSTSTVVTVDPVPSVVAGQNLEACQSPAPVAITLTGASFAGSATAATWSILEGDGTLSNSGPTPDPASVTFTPAADFSGTVTLLLTSNASNSCEPATQVRVITITERPLASAGGLLTVCQSASPAAITLTDASVSGGATTGAWSIISGGGSLSSDVQTANPSEVMYTPAPNYAGEVKLRLTTDAEGECSPLMVERTIMVSPPPTASAGGDLTTCEQVSNVNISVGSSASNYTSLSWESSGTGTFTNNTSLTDATYTPSLADEQAGSVTITLRANGGGCSDAVSTRLLTITKLAIVNAGTAVSVCEGSGAIPITTGASASNYSSVLWTSDGTGTISNPTSLTSATYTPGTNETGVITLTLTATGNAPCGSPVSSKTVTINPNATIVLTSAAATASQTVCINSAITPITYTIAGGGTGANFSGLPAGVTGAYLNGIVTINGSPSISGSFAYTVTTSGTCGQTSLGGTINVSPVTAGGTILPALVTGCTGTISGTPLTLSGSAGNVVQWESSVNGGATWSVISNTGLTQSYNGLTQTTIYRALLQSGPCGTAYSSISVVSVIPKFNPVAVATPASICVGQSSVLSSTTGYPTPGISDQSGNFSDANPTGWRRDGETTGDFLPANGDNTANGVWRETNNQTFNGIAYSSTGKFAIVSGQYNSELETSVFSLIGQQNLNFEFIQAYNLFAGTTAFIEISTDGGNTYPEILAQYSGVSQYGISGTTGTLQPTSFSLAKYIGLANLRIRFRYVGTASSSWALDNVRVPAVLPITYSWTSNPSSTFADPTLGSVTVSPTVTTTYTLTTMVNGCPAGTADVTVTVNPLPTLALGGTLQNGTVITCFGSPSAPLPYTGTNLPTGSNYSITWSAAAGNVGFSPVTNGVLSGTAISLELPVGVAAGTYTGTVTIRNTNGCSGAESPFTLIVNPAPTLGTVTAAPLCNVVGSTALTVNLAGLLPSSTSTVIYQIGGGSAVTVSGIAADASGNGSFQASVTSANDGQSLIITSISSTTTNSISCAITPASNNTMVLMVKSGYVWTGLGTNNLWSNAANWMCKVPPSGSSVIIPKVDNGNYPLLDVMFTSNGFDLQAEATIQLINNVLTLGTSDASVITTNGTIIGSNVSGIVIYGSFTTSLKFDQTTMGVSNSLATLSKNSSGLLTLGNPLWIIGDVYPNGGELASNGNLTMVSTATTSSNIGPIQSGADVTGDVNVQVYITGDGVTTTNRGFRMMSSPINDALISGKKTFAQIKDYIVVTGAGGEANGFDQGGWAQPYAETITLYNEPALPTEPAFVTIPTINEPNISGTGFYLFFRGSQGGSYAANSNKVNAPYVAPEPVTVNYKGPINKFNVTPVVLRNSGNAGDAQNGYNMVGNPYPSSIDWTRVSRSPNVVNSVIIYKVGGAQVSYINGVSNGGGTPIIQPGQGFYVRTSADGETLSFTEDSKSATYPGRFLKLPQMPYFTMSAGVPLATVPDENLSHKEILRLNVFDGKNSEETTLVFEAGGAQTAGYEDVVYMSGGVINLASLSSDDKNLAINGLPEIAEVAEVRLNVNGVQGGNFQFRFTDIPKFKGCKILLVDALFPDIQKEVKKNATYEFTVDKGNPSTFGNKRFKLIFKPIEVKKPLEVKTFTVKKVKNVSELQFTLGGDEQPAVLEVERSFDGKTFYRLSELSVGQPSGVDKKYQLRDTNPRPGLNYYRIRVTDTKGEVIVSEIISVEYLDEELDVELISVYPNPVKNQVEVRLSRVPDGPVDLRIVDLYGRSVLSDKSALADQLRYDVGGFKPAVYFIEVRASGDGKLLGRTKFIKGD